MDADHGRSVEDALELPVVALRSMQVSCAIARVALGRRRSGVAGEVIGGGEPGQRAARWQAGNWAPRTSPIPVKLVMMAASCWV